MAQLLLHAPRRYLDRSQLFDLTSVPLGEEVTVGGVVQSVSRRRISKNRVMVEATIGDGTSTLHAVWFNPYLKLEKGEEVAISGKAELFRGRLQMKAPDLDRLDQEDALVTGRVVPVHPSVGGMKPMKIREAVANALRRSRPITEVVPADILNRLDLVGRDQSIATIHFPDDHAEANRARERLIFDEFFRIQVALAMRKQRQGREAKSATHALDGAIVAQFLGALPYRLTGAQERVIEEIRIDLAGRHPMHRLLQGEVGSGKTVVALATLLVAVQGGYQGAIMAPTEVLAEQHYLSTVDALESAGLAPDGGPDASGTGNLFAREGAPDVRMALLTANRAITNFGGSADRGTVTGWIADGMVDLVIGTHALIQEGVHFERLGIAVVDEQHRFGVHQRVRLRDKASDHDPDLLIMTATPIPRTLSMTLYGDLDVSILDELPPGRLPVETRHVPKDPESIEVVYDLVRSEVAAGRQAFVVCPLVEDSDEDGGEVGDRRVRAAQVRLPRSSPWSPSRSDAALREGRCHAPLPGR